MTVRTSLDAFTTPRMRAERLRLDHWADLRLTLTTNRASRRVLEKTGLVYERDVVHAGLLHALFRIVNQGVAR